MKIYVLYWLAIVVMAFAVDRMLDDEYNAGLGDLEQEKREAWSDGFTRGALSNSK